jgi:hypothetical protein
VAGATGAAGAAGLDPKSGSRRRIASALENFSRACIWSSHFVFSQIL